MRQAGERPTPGTAKTRRAKAARARAVVPVVTLAVLIGLAVSACTSPADGTGASHGRGTPSTLAPRDGAPETASADPIAGMTLAQQVGQLFMVGTTASAAQRVTRDAIVRLHAGSVFLSGRSHLGVAGTAGVVRSLSAEVSATATGGEPLFVATDQEGGEVQVLQGPGFSAMPTGLAQASIHSSKLAADAATWGAQLHAAGVTMDLAPVVDLISRPADAPENPPIGAFQRELGFSATAIESHADAIRDSLASAGVVTVLKHFPGLGHVRQNTDTATSVTDNTVTTNGADVGIYRTEIAAGAPVIMVSSAVYSRIDPSRPAVFSPTVVTGLLRGSLGFRGVVITDDLSAAAQVEHISPANRAIDAISAGVDIVLVSSVPEVASTMIPAVLAKAETDPAFALLVADAARRVVELKDRELPAAGSRATTSPVVGLPRP